MIRIIPSYEESDQILKKLYITDGGKVKKRDKVEVFFPRNTSYGEF